MLTYLSGEITIIGVSERTSRRHLNDLVKAGKARKQGDGPANGYHIID
jgi:predicted HTH transcriptional regulator